MVGTGILSNNMRSPSPECYTTFWMMTIFSGTFHWSGIAPIVDLVTDLGLITEFDFLPNCERFPKNIINGCGMPTEDAYSSGHLTLSHFGTYKCSYVETNLSWTCHVSGLLSFEHPSVLLFCFVSYKVCKFLEFIVYFHDFSPWIPLFLDFALYQSDLRYPGDMHTSVYDKRHDDFGFCIVNFSWFKSGDIPRLSSFAVSTCTFHSWFVLLCVALALSISIQSPFNCCQMVTDTTSFEKTYKKCSGPILGTFNKIGAIPCQEY